MGELLKKMAEGLGYKVVTERTSHGGGRLDQTWKKGDHEITIEHEHDYKTIDKEIRNLCDHRSQLKVLITYVPDEDFLASAVETANKVKQDIAQQGSFHGEFLLVIGPYCNNDWLSDWAAFHSIRDIRMLPLRGKPNR